LGGGSKTTRTGKRVQKLGKFRKIRWDANLGGSREKKIITERGTGRKKRRKKKRIAEKSKKV